MIDGLAKSTRGSRASTNFKHFILTRFNVRFVVDPNEPSIAVDPGWLADRFDLFERYCLPSVLAQSEKNFSWMLFFDKATPEPFAARARALSAEFPWIHATFCETLPVSLVIQTVRGLLPQPPDRLLTTRLDNDDGVHVDFVATVQGAQCHVGAEVLNCPDGVILRGDRAYHRRDLSNAFISLSEPFSDARTVLSIARHIYAGESYPVRQIADRPMWLQVIHDRNVSNRVRGWRIPLREAAAGFPPLNRSMAGGPREKPAAILLENLSLSSIRFLRDLAISITRSVARLFGVELRRKPVPRRGRAVAPRES